MDCSVMMEAAMDGEKPSPQPYPADKARGGFIELRKPWQRAVFIAGLAAPVALILVLLLLDR
jgi:hypothetical protein